ISYVLSLTRSVVLAPRGPIRRLSRFRLTRLFRKVAALFTTSNATVRPQTFENHLGCAGNGSCVFAIGDAQAPDVLHQALDFRELLTTVGSRGQLGQLQLATQLEPLNHGLKIDLREMLAEDAADRGANQLPRNRVRTLQLAFIFLFELAGNRREGSINIRHACEGILFADARCALLGVADDAFQRSDG